MFHRIDNWETMSARKFIAFVERLPFYRGALRDIVLIERARSDKPADALPPQDDGSGLPPAIQVLKAS